MCARRACTGGRRRRRPRRRLVSFVCFDIIMSMTWLLRSQQGFHRRRNWAIVRCAAATPPFAPDSPPPPPCVGRRSPRARGAFLSVSLSRAFTHTNTHTHTTRGRKLQTHTSSTRPRIQVLQKKPRAVDCALELRSERRRHRARLKNRAQVHSVVSVATAV